MDTVYDQTPGVVRGPRALITPISKSRVQAPAPERVQVLSVCALEPWIHPAGWRTDHQAANPHPPPLTQAQQPAISENAKPKPGKSSKRLASKEKREALYRWSTYAESRSGMSTKGSCVRCTCGSWRFVENARSKSIGLRGSGSEIG